MPRLPLVKPNDLIKYLHKKGFRPHKHAKGKGSHIVMYNQQTNRWTTIQTNKKQIGPNMLLTILAEAGISREEFMSDPF